MALVEGDEQVRAQQLVVDLAGDVVIGVPVPDQQRRGPVPALTTATRSASPARSTSRAKTFSAIGERQMLPEHTNTTRYTERSSPIVPRTGGAGRQNARPGSPRWRAFCG